MLKHIPNIVLNNGTSQPLVGYGTYKVGYVPPSASGSKGVAKGHADDAEDIVAKAISLGYRFLDCAQFYGNEAAVGCAIEKSKVSRSELFLASKIWCDNIYKGSEAIRSQVERTLKDLKTKYLDLYLIHWPVPGKHVQAYKTLEKLVEKGLIRSIGFSNYTIEDYEELKREGIRVRPVVNQIEVNPFLFRKKTIAYFQKKEGIVIQAYRGLRQGKHLNHPLLVELSEKYEKSPAQIMGRFVVQSGVVYITKSIKASRMLENADIFDFEIETKDMSRLCNLTTPQNLDTFRSLYFKCIVRDTPLETEVTTTTNTATSAAAATTTTTQRKIITIE
jgi:diketogulonate reductase-like aldo/keto reductase